MLVQAASDSSSEDAYRRGFSLILMLSILGIVLVICLALIVVIRRAQRRSAALPKQGSTEHIDAWAEAGRRMDDSITQIDVDSDSDPG